MDKIEKEVFEIQKAFNNNGKGYVFAPYILFEYWKITKDGFVIWKKK